MSVTQDVPPGVDPTRPSPARLYDYYLGGTHNFPVDRESDPWGLVASYMAAVAPGSYLALSHGTSDNIPSRLIQVGVDTYEQATDQVYLRSKGEIERFFDGLELVPPYHGADPAVTFAGLWGAEDPVAADSEGSRGIYCGVARRP